MNAVAPTFKKGTTHPRGATMAAVVLALFAMTTQHAQALTPKTPAISGRAAQNVMALLENNGAVAEAITGAVVVKVRDVQCGSTHAHDGASCAMTVTSEKNHAVIKVLSKRESNLLLESMIASGAADCGKDSCQAHVPALDCTLPNADGNRNANTSGNANDASTHPSICAFTQNN